MTIDDHKDILIVGAGVAGSSLALALDQQGLSIALLDAQVASLTPTPSEASVSGFDARVFALNLKSLEFLDDLGILEDMTAQRLQFFDRLNAIDGEGLGEITCHAADIQRDKLGAIVEHRVLQNSLLKSLQYSSITRMEGISIHRVSSDKTGKSVIRLTNAKGEEKNLSCHLLIGADGGNSLIRKETGFKTRQWSYHHQAIVCTVELQQHHGNKAWQRFMYHGPLAFLPLPTVHRRHFASIVWSVTEPFAKKLTNLSDEAFQVELEQASELAFGKLNAVSSRFSFPLKQLHATEYVKKGIALVADAAHTIHPLAGQGMNLGLADVRVLSEELAFAGKKGLPVDALQPLKRYERRRKGENLAMMAAIEGLKRIFEQPSLSFSLARHLGMQSIQTLPYIKSRIVRHAAGL